MARLDQICTLKMGQSPDSSSYNEVGKGIPFFQGNADFGNLHPKVRVWCSAPTKIARTGDVLISVRAPIGALNIADRECCIGRGLAALTVNEELCIKDYLWHAIASKVDELNNKGTGSTFKAISKSILAETDIPLPSLAKQLKIAEELTAVDKMIALRKEQLTKLDQLVKSRFIELFGNTKNKVPVGEMCNITGGYSFKSGDISNDGAIKILQIGNVYLDNVNWDTINYLPEGYDEKYSRFLLNEGDIVVALTRPIIQSLGNVKACIVKLSDLPCLLNQRVGRIVPKEEKSVLLDFIYGCLMTDDFTRYVESCSIGCSQPNISTKDIENYLIPSATYEEQTEYVEFKKQTDKSKLAIQQSLEKLETLKKSLMQEYFG